MIRQCLTSMFRGLSAVLMTSMVLGACQADDRGGKSTPPASSSKPPASTPTPDDSSAPSQLLQYEKLRLLRRLTLDLLHRLPSASERQAILSGALSFETLVDHVLAYPQLGAAIAEKHRSLWQLGSSAAPTPDLSRFATDDADLAAHLSARERWNLLSSPLQRLRYVIEFDKPYAELLSGSWSLVHSDWLTLLGEEAVATPWLGEPWRLVHYAGQRRALGILGDHGYAARFDSHAADAPYGKVADLYQDLTCQSFNTGNAHLWTELSDAAMESGKWRELAVSDKACFACHGTYQSHLSLHMGAHHGASLADWTSFAPATEPAEPAWYSGHSVTSLAGFTSFLAADPRVHLCAINNLATGLLQSPLDPASAANMISSLFTKFRDSGLRLRPLVKLIVQSPLYQSTAAEGSTEGLTPAEAIHVLSYQQWQDVFLYLQGDAPATVLPKALAPGVDSIGGDKRHVPHGSYAHHARRVARLLAQEVVNSELGVTTLPATRVFFKHLPAEPAGEASATVIEAQMLYLWQLLTNQELTADSEQYGRLRSLWQSAWSSRTAAAEANQVAWRLVLTAIFLSPDFLVY